MPRRRDGGFTLIELMVVVLIIAVLIAIAIPSFLGFRRSSQEKSAQVSLITAEKHAYLLYLENGIIPDQAGLLVQLPLLEPAIVWLDHLVDSTGPHEVSVDQTAGGTQLALAARSDSGTCFYSRVDMNGVTSKHRVDNAATCNSHDYQLGADTGW